jgi:Asp-tRNA(Asn)/Glu-tRNA(Gln) amidotransferase B subunit
MLTAVQPDEGKITIQIGNYFYDVTPEQYQRIQVKRNAIASKGGTR